MGVARAYIDMGDGRRIECDVQNVTIEHEPMNAGSYILSGQMEEYAYTRVRVEGIVNKLELNEDEEMTSKECDEKSLSVKYKELDLDENTLKLRKKGLLKVDGTLTEKGKDFLLNFLIEEFEEKIVEALEVIEDSEKED